VKRKDGRFSFLLACALAIVPVLIGFTAQAKTGKSSPANPQKARPVQVMVELFQVALLDGDKLRYLHRQGLLDTRGPDAVVAELLRGKTDVASFFAKAPVIVHSTSWRFEDDGTVVLTYLAFGEAADSPPDRDVRTVAKADLPEIGTTDPDRPRPATLHHEDVLAHGLRHLALLARRTGGQAFARRLSMRERAFFTAIEPEIAGEIRDGRPAIPSMPGAPR
jgi:hypothetical protein